jgi:hypothetical protein
MMRTARLLVSLLLAALPSRLCAQVPYDRIVAADREPGSWLT